MFGIKIQDLKSYGYQIDFMIRYCLNIRKRKIKKIKSKYDL